LRETAKAIRYLEEGHAQGKLLITVELITKPDTALSPTSAGAQTKLHQGIYPVRGKRKDTALGFVTILKLIFYESPRFK
jgi:hypothetical protein